MRTEAIENKVLFVDDDMNVLKAFKRLFRDEDFEIETESDSIKALEMVKTGFFQVIVSDYRMPEINGVEFLKRVSIMSPRSIRIILTGHADVDNSVSAINEGHVYKFLTKPWDDEFFKLEIREALEFQQLVNANQTLEQELLLANSDLEEMNENLEQKVEERTHQLLQSEKMATLGQIAAQIGHEISNSLTVLSGNLYFLKNFIPKKSKAEKHYNLCNNAVDSLSMYARNLLTLGRPTPAEFQNINIADSLNTTINKLNEINILKYYDITYNHNNQNIIVHADPAQLDQVFTNILINAHHAMDCTGSLTIDQVLNDKYVELSIIDTGHGISKDNLERIFEPFFTTKPEGKGTGLGMAVIKKIVENHNGKIGIESELDVGTTVRIILPLSA